MSANNNVNSNSNGDEDDHSVVSSYSAFSAGSWAGGGPSSVYSSSSQADAFATGFAMRQGMGLDGGGLLSAMMDGGDSGSVASFGGSSSYMNRKKKSSVASSVSGSDASETAVKPAPTLQERAPSPRKTVDTKRTRQRIRNIRSKNEWRQIEKQQSTSTRRSRGAGSESSRVLDKSDIRKLPPKLQSAALVLLDLDGDTSQNAPRDLEAGARTSSSSTKTSSFRKGSFRTKKASTMWEQKKSKAETNLQRDQLNLNATSYSQEMEHDDTMWENQEVSVKASTSGDNMQFEDQFLDEIPLDYKHDDDSHLHEKRMSLDDQLNKRKRIKIYKRKKSLKPQRRGRGRWFYATILAVVAVVLIVMSILTAVFVTEAKSKNSGMMNGSSTDLYTAAPAPTPLMIEETFPIDSNHPNVPAVSITTVPPSQPPTPSPTIPLSAHPPSNCFTSRDQLKEAVDAYMMDHSKYSPVAQKYGFPIGEWCTTFVTDFSNLFHNGDLSTGLIDHEDTLSIKFAHFDESLSKWDVSHGVSFVGMFRGAKHFSGHGLDKWNVSKATTMSHMFHEAEHFNQDLNNWNTSRVVDFSSMFEGAKTFNGDVSSWDTASATNMKRMWRNAFAFNGDLRGWNLSKVEHLQEAFARALSFQGGDLRRWDTSKVKSMEGLFFHAKAFKGIISTWDVSSVVTMSQMFQGAEAFNSVISAWDMSSVQDTSFMFAFATDFNSPLSSWNTAKLQQADAMFMNATSFNQPLNDWNVSSVLAADVMFAGAKSFNQPLDFWTLASADKIGGMFTGAASFHQNLCAWGESIPGGEDRHTLLRSDHLEAQHTAIFSGTKCPEVGNPLFLLHPAGPFCEKCS